MEKELKSKDDASPLTTSTESETFDTWTVISDKSKDITQDEITFSPPTPDRSEDDDDVTADVVRVEVLKPSDEPLGSRYNDIDDLSDGISIISECESVERLSPHPELRKHLSDLSMRFMDVREPVLRLKKSNDESTSRNYEASSEHSSDAFHQMETFMDKSNRRTRRTSCQLVEPDTNLQPALRCGLRGLFYVGAVLAVLAFISKLKYESVLGTSTELLNQKIEDLELKNNLMRAEIDILAKQVNYLTSLSETQKYATSSKPKSNASNSKEKKIKVWPGNGNTIEEVEISRKDQKTPFKCDNHNNVDIAGMCIELPKTSESVIDTLGDKVRVVIDGNEQFAHFEKVVDRMAKFTENPFAEQQKDHPTENEAHPNEAQQPKFDYTPHEHKPDKYDSKKYDKRDYQKKYKNDSGESKEKERSRRDRSNEDFSGSGERFKKSKDYKKYDKYSSSEYEKAKRDADGQWHEKLMQHRETARKNNDKHRHDKNWYIERGDSREEARVSEQKYR